MDIEEFVKNFIIVEEDEGNLSSAKMMSTKRSKEADAVHLQQLKKDLPPISDPVYESVANSQFTPVDSINNSHTLRALLARFYAFFPDFRSKSSTLNPSQYVQ